MKKILRSIYKTIFANKFLTPLFEVRFKNFANYIGYFKDYRTYKKSAGSQSLAFKDLKPILDENVKVANIDPHYFYQGIWAAGKIILSQAREHIDVGSKVDFVGFLTNVVKVKFVDIRILDIQLNNFEMIKGSILDLPFPDNSITSLSCLHVAEHIGLGRYGDPINPQGTKEACRELARVLASGGNLYFSLPIGKERICFNAHRIHNTSTILEYFKGLKLVEFSAINDNGQFLQHATMEEFKESKYSCGLFHFTKI